MTLSTSIIPSTLLIPDPAILRYEDVLNMLSNDIIKLTNYSRNRCSRSRNRDQNCTLSQNSARLKTWTVTTTFSFFALSLLLSVGKTLSSLIPSVSPACKDQGERRAGVNAETAAIARRTARGNRAGLR